MFERAWEYECPECGARISSGFPDPICPIPTCGAVLDVLIAPEPTDQEVAEMLAEAEELVSFS